MEVRALIQQIALEHRGRYGSRRIARELHNRGLPVNRKRVVRMMREDNLLAVQPRSFLVTTDSNHKLEVYLNLARRLKLTGVNQLWVADITYIDSGRVLPQGGRLGVAADAGNSAGGGGAGAGDPGTPAASGTGPPF
jgi:transposase InsO family protein